MGGVQLAGFGRRLLARLIDGVILILLDLGIFGLAVLIVAAVPDTAGGFVAVLLILSLVLSGPIYEALWIGESGQTVRKRAVGIKVVRDERGGKPSYGAAVRRTFLVFAMGIVPLLLFVVFPWALFNQRKQGLHDLAAGTIVVRVTRI